MGGCWPKLEKFDMNAAISFPTMRNGASHLNGFDIQIEAIKSMVRGFELVSEIENRGSTTFNELQ